MNVPLLTHEFELTAVPFGRRDAVDRDQRTCGAARGDSHCGGVRATSGACAACYSTRLTAVLIAPAMNTRTRKPETAKAMDRSNRARIDESSPRRLSSAARPTPANKAATTMLSHHISLSRAERIRSIRATMLVAGGWSERMRKKTRSYRRTTERKPIVDATA